MEGGLATVSLGVQKLSTQEVATITRNVVREVFSVFSVLSLVLKEQEPTVLSLPSQFQSAWAHSTSALVVLALIRRAHHVKQVSILFSFHDGK